jgi:hypothetical protein
MLPHARVYELQARTHADIFGDMERPATDAERHPAPHEHDAIAGAPKPSPSPGTSANRPARSLNPSPHARTTR